MKTIQLLAIGAFVLGLSALARAQSDTKPGYATVLRVTGEARYSVDGKTWHPLVNGQILGAGAVLETAMGSTADLIVSEYRVPVQAPQVGFVPQQVAMASDPNLRGWVAYEPKAEQNVMRIGPSSVLAIDQLTVDNTGADTVSDTELDLRAGKIFTGVKKMSASSKYFIKFPNGVAGIRGSALSIDTGNANTPGTVNVLTGSAVVSYTTSQGDPTQVLGQGQSLNLSNGSVYNTPANILAFLDQTLSILETDLHQTFRSSTTLTLYALIISTTTGKITTNGEFQPFP